MWAVGRLSLLSRGLTAAAKGTPAPTETPLAPPPPAPAPKPAAPAEARLPARGTLERAEAAAPLFPPRTAPPPAREPVAEPAVAPPPAAGLIQRIVSRVAGFFRSLFG